MYRYSEYILNTISHLLHKFQYSHNDVIWKRRTVLIYVWHAPWKMTLPVHHICYLLSTYPKKKDEKQKHSQREKHLDKYSGWNSFWITFQKWQGISEQTMLRSHPKTKDVPLDFQNAKLNMLKSVSYNDTSIPNCLAFGPGHHVTLLLSCSRKNFFRKKKILVG